MSEQLARRVSLTHWNTDIQDSRDIPILLSEVIVLGLIYDEVVLNDIDLIHNQTIVDILRRDEQQFEIFKGLIGNGILRLVTLPSNRYSKSLKVDPERSPILARAREASVAKTLKERIFVPREEDLEFYRRVDVFLRRHRGAIEPMANMDQRRFREPLAAILGNPQRFPLEDFPAFRGIDGRVAREMAELAGGEKDWISFLRGAGVPAVKTGESGAFFRSAAYQCLSVLAQQHRTGTRGMRNLIQSVFATGFCEAQGTEGRYGRRLSEIPGSAFAPGAAEVGRIVDVQAPLSFALHPRVAEVLADTREHPARRALQEAERKLSAGDEGARDAWAYAWKGTVEAFASNAAHAMQGLPKRWEMFWTAVGMLYEVGAVVGMSFQLTPPLSIKLAHIGLATALAVGGPVGMERVRNAVLQRKIKGEVRKVLQLRCSSVLLPARLG